MKLNILQDIFIKDWKIKLICILFAFILWSYIHISKINATDIRVPIEYKNIPDNIEFASKPISFATIRIRGKKEDLKFPTSNLKAEVTLSDAKIGSFEYEVDFDSRQLPEKVEVTRISKVQLSFEKIIQKNLWVKANIKGEASEGFKQGRIIVLPKKVLLKGPKSRLDKLREIFTKEIDISGAEKDVQEYVELAIPYSKISPVRNNKVLVEIKIFETNTFEERIMDNIEILVSNLDPVLKASLSQDKVKFYLRGNSKELNLIQKTDLSVVADLEGTRYDYENNTILPYSEETSIPLQPKILKFNDKVSVFEIKPDYVGVKFFLKNNIILKEKKLEEKSSPKEVSVKDNKQKENDPNSKEFSDP